ncbi:MAG: YnbE family lipoprotein [Nitrospirae bacterium]|nr:YnbE family lipoprotein [Nitrospirota bacterium]MDA1304473.1 YnbE family lipoprotein [Nitrospirota bacterium]
MKTRPTPGLGIGLLLSGLLLLSCTPRIEVAPSEKPITINLNVKIDHEIRVKVEKDLEAVFSEESKLF